MIPRKTTGNIPDDQTQNTPSVFDDDAANDNERAEEAQEEEGSILETEVESVPSTSAKRSLANTHLLETTPTAPMKRKKKKNMRDTTIEKLVDIEQQKLVQFKEHMAESTQRGGPRPEDDHSYFLLSLAPYLK